MEASMNHTKFARRNGWIGAVLLSGLLFEAMPAPLQNKELPEVLLQRAIQKETVDGDLKGAIEQYRKVAQSSIRPLAAQALVHMAECYQKLGDAEARKIYERVVREFADQKEAVATARAWVGGNATTQNAGIVTRQVLTGPNVYIYGSVSPDGRYLSFVDQGTGDLALHDLANGKDRRLTNQGTGFESGEGAQDPVISPDGKQVAYSWRNRDGRSDLRLMGLNGSGPATPQVLYDNEDINIIVPADWSPDGKWIAVQLRRKDETTQIGLVSATAHSLRVLKSVDWRASSKVLFSPDGKYLAFDLASSQDSEQRDVFVLAADGSREIPAVVHRADDVVMGWTPDGRQLLFASDRTGAPGLWALPFGDGEPQAPPELVKADVGRPRSLGITRSGALYFGVSTARPDLYIASVDFDSGKVLTPPLRQELVGFASQPDWAPDGKYVVYGTSSDPLRYHETLAVRSVETGQTRELRPNLSQFNWPRWAPDGRSFAVQGRDAKGRQGIYRVDAETAELSPLVQSLPGDSSANPRWAPDGNRIFYKLFFDGRKEAAIMERDLASGTQREVWRGKTYLGGVSVAPDGRYVAFRTSDPATQESLLLAVPVGGGAPRELVRLQAPQALVANWTEWTRDSQFVIFDKNLSATRLDLEYGIVPLSGGQPRKVDLNVRGNFYIHPDGSQVVLAAGQAKFEVWALENFLPLKTAR